MTMRLTLDSLIVLDAINRKGSFAAAADELSRVRSALTYSVQKIEEDLGVKLFDRSGYKAQLTPAGKLLLEKGRQLLRMARDMERQIRQVETGWESELTIGYNDIFSFSALFQLLAQFYQECPGVKLNITSEILSGCWDALLSGRADIVIGVNGDAPAGSEFGMQPLGADIKFVFAVAPNHPLAKYPEPLKDVDIVRYRSIAAADTTRGLPPLSAGILAGQEVLTMPTVCTKMQAQIAGLGAGYLPMHIAKPAIQAGELIVKKTEKGKLTASNFSVAWNLRQEGKAMKWLLMKLKDPKLQKKLLG